MLGGADNQMVNYRLISLALTIAVPFTPDMV